jgi:hypothetical protein
VLVCCADGFECERAGVDQRPNLSGVDELRKLASDRRMLVASPNYWEAPAEQDGGTT